MALHVVYYFERTTCGEIDTFPSLFLGLASLMCWTRGVLLIRSPRNSEPTSSLLAAWSRSGDGVCEASNGDYYHFSQSISGHMHIMDARSRRQARTRCLFSADDGLKLRASRSSRSSHSAPRCCCRSPLRRQTPLPPLGSALAPQKVRTLVPCEGAGCAWRCASASEIWAACIRAAQPMGGEARRARASVTWDSSSLWRDNTPITAQNIVHHTPRLPACPPAVAPAKSPDLGMWRVKGDMRGGRAHCGDEGFSAMLMLPWTLGGVQLQTSPA